HEQPLQEMLAVVLGATAPAHHGTHDPEPWVDAHRRAEKAKAEVELRFAGFEEKHDAAPSSFCGRKRRGTGHQPLLQGMLLVMDWTSLREQFPVARRWAYFDHAAIAPLSGPAQRAVAEWAADMADNGDVHEPLWFRRTNEVRGLAARLLGADPLDVAFV